MACYCKQFIPHDQQKHRQQQTDKIIEHIEKPAELTLSFFNAKYLECEDLILDGDSSMKNQF